MCVRVQTSYIGMCIVMNMHEQQPTVRRSVLKGNFTNLRPGESGWKRKVFPECELKLYLGVTLCTHLGNPTTNRKTLRPTPPSPLTLKSPDRGPFVHVVGDLSGTLIESIFRFVLNAYTTNESMFVVIHENAHIRIAHCQTRVRRTSFSPTLVDPQNVTLD